MISEKKSSIAYPMIGLIAVSAFVAAWFFAIADNSSWVFGEDLIEVLRVSDSGKYLVLGLSVSGVLLAISSIGRIFSDDSRPFRSAEGMFLLVAGIMLVWVGFFDHGEKIHQIAAIMACFSFAVAMVLSAADDFENNRHMVWGSLTVLIIAVMAISYMAYLPAEVQMMEMLGVIIWAGLRFLKDIVG